MIMLLAAIPIAVLDLACAPATLKVGETAVLTCAALLDHAPPKGSSCHWEFGPDGAQGTECRGKELETVHQIMRNVSEGLIAIRFAVFAPKGELLVDRTTTIEVKP